MLAVSESLQKKGLVSFEHTLSYVAICVAFFENTVASSLEVKIGSIITNVFNIMVIYSDFLTNWYRPS